MKKRLLLAFTLLMAVTTLFAERVSEEDAALVANNFMSASVSVSGAKRSPKMVLKKSASAAESQFYVYENPGGGWVMVSASDVAHPVLAYSLTGSFRTDNQPENLKALLNGYERQIKRAEADGLEASAKIAAEWAAAHSGLLTAGTPVVNPLIETGWDQGSPYWNLCPKKNGNTCPVGCTATALAQVMYYWQWPKQGTGSHSLQFNDGTNDITLSADFGATTYDWDNMLKTYKSNGSDSNDAQKLAIATLMYHCGIACDMEYDEGGSGAALIDFDGYYSGQGIMSAETALTQFFGYKASTVKGNERDNGWTAEAWIAMLEAELKAARPVLYAGFGFTDPDNEDTAYGHSFICDGYDNLHYFHFNFGWSNWCDGYYDIDAVEPTDPGTGGGNGEYNSWQQAVIGIIPDKPCYVTWSISGEAGTPIEYASGAPLVLPTEPTCDGKTFVGWTESSQISGKPADLFKIAGNKKVTEDVTYYAVFATLDGEGGGSSEITLTAGTDTSDGLTLTKDGVTIELSNGTLSRSDNYRCYAKGTMTVSAESTITKIVLNCNASGTSKGGPGCFSADGYSYDGKVGTWEGEAKSVVFTAGQQVQINSMVVTIDGVSYKDYTLDCGSAPEEVTLTPTVAEVTLYPDESTNGKYKWIIKVADGPISGTHSFLMTVGFYTSVDNAIAGTFSGNSIISGQLDYNGQISSTAVTMTLAAAGAKSTARKASTTYNYNVTIAFTGNDGKIYNINKTVSLTAKTANSDEDPLDPGDPQAETCTITWMVCGMQYGVQTVSKGSALVLPTEPEAKEGRQFYGWTTNPNYNSKTAPTKVEAGTIVNADVTYYAVFK